MATRWHTNLQMCLQRWTKFSGTCNRYVYSSNSSLHPSRRQFLSKLHLFQEGVDLRGRRAKIRLEPPSLKSISKVSTSRTSAKWARARAFCTPSSSTKIFPDLVAPNSILLNANKRPISWFGASSSFGNLQISIDWALSVTPKGLFRCFWIPSTSKTRVRFSRIRRPHHSLWCKIWKVQLPMKLMAVKFRMRTSGANRSRKRIWHNNKWKKSCSKRTKLESSSTKGERDLVLSRRCA